ncbi:hypothetical protein GW750_03020 [bacterium]|nr:hypothetical protein [bacterium]
MIGSLLLTKLQIDALKRAESQERPPMYVFIDEFQSFLTDSFRTMFAE